jgi:hypothetical protein
MRLLKLFHLQGRYHELNQLELSASICRNLRDLICKDSPAVIIYLFDSDACYEVVKLFYSVTVKMSQQKLPRGLSN